MLVSKLGSKKSVREYNMEPPAVFSPAFVLTEPPATTIFITQIQISGTATFPETRFGIISRVPLPSIGFRVRINCFERRAQLKDSVALQITPEQYKYH